MLEPLSQVSTLYFSHPGSVLLCRVGPESRAEHEMTGALIKVTAAMQSPSIRNPPRTSRLGWKNTFKPDTLWTAELIGLLQEFLP